MNKQVSEAYQGLLEAIAAHVLSKQQPHGSKPSTSTLQQIDVCRARLQDACENTLYLLDETDKYIEAAVQLGNLSETDTDSALQLHRDTQKFVEALRQQSLQS
ncbi:hypothetical protein WJX84_002162 [Apatococcus fuscideae]|uniref:Uncharacterized protein n=1 Tax=Apatococcus fuscideae TaxID=2026836 RepID=A0AAW1S8Y8_9CHLO